MWRAELNKHSRCSPTRRGTNRSTFVITPLPLLTSTTRISLTRGSWSFSPHIDDEFEDLRGEVGCGTRKHSWNWAGRGFCHHRPFYNPETAGFLGLLPLCFFEFYFLVLYFSHAFWDHRFVALANSRGPWRWWYASLSSLRITALVGPSLNTLLNV